MANVVDIVARFRDEASGALGALGSNLERLAKTGIEPIARISPTAANALEGFIGRMGPAGLAATAFAGTTVGVVAGLTKIVTSTANLGDTLDEMSVKTGVGVESLQGLQLAAEKSGSSLEGVVGSFRLLGRNIEAAAQGGKEQAEAFHRLGLSFDILRSLKPEQQFEAVAKAIAALPTPTERTAAALQVFGRSGSELLPTLKEVAEKGVAGLTNRVRELGGLISTSAAQQAGAFNDKLKELGTAATGLSTTFGVALLPAFDAIAASLVRVAENVAEFEKRTEAISFSGRVAGNLLQGTAQIIEQLGKSAVTTLEPLAGLSNSVDKLAVSEQAAAALRVLTSELGLTGPMAENVAAILQGKAAPSAAKLAEEAHKAAMGAKDLATEAKKASDAIAAMGSASGATLPAIQALGPNFADIAKAIAVAGETAKTAGLVEQLEKFGPAMGLSAEQVQRAVSGVMDQLKEFERTGVKSLAMVTTKTEDTADSMKKLETAGAGVVKAFETVGASATTLVTATGSAEETVTRLLGHTEGPLGETLVNLISKGRELMGTFDQANASAEDLLSTSQMVGSEAGGPLTVGIGGNLSASQIAQAIREAGAFGGVGSISNVGFGSGFGTLKETGGVLQQSGVMAGGGGGLDPFQFTKELAALAAKAFGAPSAYGPVGYQSPTTGYDYGAPTSGNYQVSGSVPSGYVQVAPGVWVQPTYTSGGIPSFQHGGVMDQTGLAWVHRGERITPPGQDSWGGEEIMTALGRIARGVEALRGTLGSLQVQFNAPLQVQNDRDIYRLASSIRNIAADMNRRGST